MARGLVCVCAHGYGRAALRAPFRGCLCCSSVTNGRHYRCETSTAQQVTGGHSRSRVRGGRCRICSAKDGLGSWWSVGSAQALSGYALARATARSPSRCDGRRCLLILRVFTTGLRASRFFVTVFVCGGSLGAWGIFRLRLPSSRGLGRYRPILALEVSPSSRCTLSCPISISLTCRFSAVTGRGNSGHVPGVIGRLMRLIFSGGVSRSASSRRGCRHRSEVRAGSIGGALWCGLRPITSTTVVSTATSATGAFVTGRGLYAVGVCICRRSVCSPFCGSTRVEARGAGYRLCACRRRVKGRGPCRQAMVKDRSTTTQEYL